MTDQQAETAVIAVASAASENADTHETKHSPQSNLYGSVAHGAITVLNHIAKTLEAEFGEAVAYLKKAIEAIEAKLHV